MGSCALPQAGMVTLRRVGVNGVIELHYFVSEQRP